MDKNSFLAFYEEAGYRVVDSFTYSDIKFFLMRNRPKTAYRVLYFAIMLLLLFFIGFMIGSMWKQTGEAGQFWLAIGGSIIFALVGCVILIPVHEFIHWLVYRNEGAADVRFGAIWRSFAFYAAAHNFLADYKTFKRIALAPLYLLSALLCLLLLYPPASTWQTCYRPFLHCALLLLFVDATQESNIDLKQKKTRRKSESFE